MDPEKVKNDLLKELRKKNAERWVKLKGLFSQHKEEDKIPVHEALLQEMRKIGHSQKISEDAFNLEPNPQDFCREVVRSYDELVETKTVLEQELQHNKEKIKTMNDILDQHTKIKADFLKSESSSTKEKVATLNDSLNLEQEWERLREELSYVAGKIERRKDDIFWSLEKLVEKLLEFYISSPSDPYLLVDSLPINPSHVEFLKRSDIIKSHEHSENLICLMDYIPETSRTVES